jgi:hypothetical protein
MPKQNDNQLIPMLPGEQHHDGCHCNGKCKTCRCGKKDRKGETPS